VTGVGFFTDAYDIFAISIAAAMLGYVYGTCPAPGPNLTQSKRPVCLRWLRVNSSLRQYAP
jgi:hypothetical protein